MVVLLSFVEAVASVPNPAVLAGHVLAAVFILTPSRAYAAGVSWGLALWALDAFFLDPSDDWTAPTLSAQALGSLSGNLIGMWAVLTVVGAVREIRARLAERRRTRDGGDL